MTEKVTCRSEIAIGVIGGLAISRYLFIYPAETARKIEDLCAQHFPRQGQSFGPLVVERDSLELFVNEHNGRALVWIVDSRIEFERRADEILTPANLERFYAREASTIARFGLPINMPPQGTFAGLPGGFAKHYFGA